jgi:hypothetical protein
MTQQYATLRKTELFGWIVVVMGHDIAQHAYYQDAVASVEKINDRCKDMTPVQVAHAYKLGHLG